MTSDVETDGASKLKRAFARVKNASKVRQIVENVELKPEPEHELEPGPSDRRTPKPTSQLVEAQQTLKEQAVEHQDGVELWPLPGLAPMTRVRTAFGDVHSIALRKGDKVLVKGGEYKAIEWINRIMLDEHVLSIKPDSNPIAMAAGSLSSGVPAQDIMVSPRQVFCADDCSGLSQPREAATLLSRSGIRRLRETGLTYTMFHVGESADIYCEGLFLRFPIES